MNRLKGRRFSRLIRPTILRAENTIFAADQPAFAVLEQRPRPNTAGVFDRVEPFRIGGLIRAWERESASRPANTVVNPFGKLQGTLKLGQAQE
jgi:hypothetical protein